MGYNRGGQRRTARLKRQKREERRLAAKVDQVNPSAPPSEGGSAVVPEAAPPTQQPGATGQ